MRRSRWILVVATVAFVAAGMSLPGTADARRCRQRCGWDWGCCDPCGTTCCGTVSSCGDACGSCGACGTCRTARYQTYYGGGCCAVEFAPMQQEGGQTFAPQAAPQMTPQTAPPPAPPAAGTQR